MNQLKTARFITQIAGWIFFFSLPLVFMYNQHNNEDVVSVVFTFNYWIFCGTFLLLFYLLKEVLLPQLYVKGRFVFYFISVFVLFIGVYVLKPFDRLMSDRQNNRRPADKHMPSDFKGAPPGDFSGPGRDRPKPPPGDFRLDRQPMPFEKTKGWLAFDIVSVFLFIMIVALTMAIEINKQLHLTQKKAIKAEADRAEAELSFLKAQINPHFLYNTLNNIYTLAITGNPNTAESIMKLSNIMRYITDDTKEEFVALQDELDCISDFIGLQELRLGEKNPVTYKVTGKVKHQKIAPLILMTFVENAFKYGVSKQKKSRIHIEVMIGEIEFKFYAQNANYAKQAEADRTGIGIENTRQRLQYLYPGKHELDIEASETLFTVNLKLVI